MGKRPFLNNILLLSALLFTACATPKPVFDCQRDPAYTKKIDRVLIVSCNEQVADENLERHFSRSMTGQMIVLLNKRGVDAHVISQNPRAIDADAEILQAVLRYQPHQILYFGPSKIRTEVTIAHGVTYRYARGQVANVTFAGRLADVASHHTVWAGDVSYWFEPEPGQVASQLLDKFDSDNLLPSPQ